ncbi:MAG: gp39 [uncultured marine phage]|uniref:Gp39 n=1 Tax=uncultured marine phage TaxID=707152 RepID=A0A8D9C9R1_9VIRU|nr:MAG: gp39 [uncultured marine phage]
MAKMQYVTYDQTKSYRDENTGEVFSAKRITNASYSHWKKNGVSKTWGKFRKGNSIEDYRNAGGVGFINPNTKRLGNFVQTNEAVPTANQSKTNSKTNGMKIKNIEMGPVKGSQFKMSLMGGIAVAVDGGYTSYNPETGELTDVTGFTMDMDGMFYTMPAQKAAVGDLVSSKHGYGYVIKSGKNKTTLLLLDGTEVKITSTKSPFGFNFVTKVVSVMDMGGAEGGIFGDMNPMMLMMMNQNGGSGNMFGGDNLMNMFMMSQMTGGSFGDFFGGKGKKGK